MQSQQERRLPVHGRRVEREDHRGADGKQLGREERRCGTLLVWRIVCDCMCGIAERKATYGTGSALAVFISGSAAKRSLFPWRQI